MDEKASKYLASRELVGNISTAQNTKKPWPESVCAVSTGHRALETQCRPEGLSELPLTGELYFLKRQHSSPSSRIFFYANLDIKLSYDSYKNFWLSMMVELPVCISLDQVLC